MLRLLSLVLLLLAGCAATPSAPAESLAPGQQLTRRGQEIMICGQLYHVGAPVVLWTDSGGYDAYRVEKRFVPLERSAWQSDSAATPNRYGLRRSGLSDEELEQVRGGGWDLPLLQRTVDQFVIHYDVCGTSRTCFRVLHDLRNLSVHFMLDIDGTIYQTLDVKERAWHAGTANDRSVGIEIANIGAYPSPREGLPEMLEQWYGRDEGGTVITIPPRLGDGGVRTPGFVGRPAREEPVVGLIHGQRLMQYDLTPEQYDSLIRLTAALCTVLPQIACDYPRDERGELVGTTLASEQLETYRGLIGHWHLQRNKIDPGPAFDWDRVVGEARRLMPSRR